MTVTKRTLLVGYDLVKPGKDYSKLIDHLKTFDGWWHNLDSTWLLRTTKTARAVRDELKGYIDANDRVLVMDVGGDNWAAYGFTQQANEWLQNHV